MVYNFFKNIYTISDVVSRDFALTQEWGLVLEGCGHYRVVGGHQQHSGYCDPMSHQTEEINYYYILFGVVP